MCSKRKFRNENNETHVKVETVNQRTLSSLQNYLVQEDAYSKLNTNINGNPNGNCQILMHNLLDAKSKTIPQKYNKRVDKKEKWMTNELLFVVNQKNDMYVDWKTNSTNIEMYETKKRHFRAFKKI